MIYFLMILYTFLRSQRVTWDQKDFSLNDYWIREIKSTTLDKTNFSQLWIPFLSGAIKLYRVDQQGTKASLNIIQCSHTLLKN